MASPPPPKMPSEPNGLQAILAQLALQDADAIRIADTAVAIWLRIDAALAPIIGHGGVAALYERSLYLTGVDHPWLLAAHQRAPAAGPFVEALRAALAQQTRADAAVGIGALLQTFLALLTSLIGGELTERLLQSVWHHPTSGPAVRDITP
jgi:hypothetical protein